MKISSARSMFGAALLLVGMAGRADAVTIQFESYSGTPLSYSEAGVTFTSLFPGGGHLHSGAELGLGSASGVSLGNHGGGCCTSPYSIDMGGSIFTIATLYYDGNPTVLSSNLGGFVILSGTGTYAVNLTGSVFNWDAEAVGFYNQGAIDDVVINAAVPEPGTMLLLGAGLVGLAMARRRKANA